MKDLMFFDANCTIGIDSLAEGSTKETLLQDMDFFGIDKALVRYTDRIFLRSALYTNAAIAECVKNESRLVGVWNILPDQCEDMPQTDTFFSQMKENNIGAISLLPIHHGFLPRRSVIGKIMDAAAERKIPVLLNAFSKKWDALYDFVETFPKNILLSIDASWKTSTDRYIRPLLENYENFYFDMTGYWTPEGIFDLAKKYGAPRILYGSGFPRLDQGSPMLQLKHSNLDDDSIALIAGKNLENLLKGAQL